MVQQSWLTLPSVCGNRLIKYEGGMMAWIVVTQQNHVNPIVA